MIKFGLEFLHECGKFGLRIADQSMFISNCELKERVPSDRTPTFIAFSASELQRLMDVLLAAGIRPTFDLTPLNTEAHERIESRMEDHIYSLERQLQDNSDVIKSLIKKL